MSVIITGFTNAANNVTATLTAVSGGASGTVTVAKVSQVNETHAGSATTTAIAAVPAATYVYEIWKANDSQASTLPIYVKIGYGSSTSFPGLQFTVGTGSNGTGTITNILSGFSAFGGTTSNQGATTYPCYFSGDAGEFRMSLWVTLANSNCQVFFAVERSKDGSGNKTSAYFTAIAFGASMGIRQQSCDSPTTFPPYDNWTTAVTTSSGNRATGFYNGTVAAFPFFPLLGTLGNPMLGIMACVAGDVTDNTTVTVASMYGSTHTYLVSKGGGNIYFAGAARANNNSTPCAILMRYE
jgi:hypothetical protein